MKSNFFNCVIITLLLTACSPVDKISYIQLEHSGDALMTVCSNPIFIQPGDQLLIYVLLSNYEFLPLYNITSVRLMNDREQEIGGYFVDSNGNIDFPSLGMLHVAGKNRIQIAEMIKAKISALDKGVKDPIVIVDFSNLYYSVVGEVNKPGRYKIPQDEFTVFDALSNAGDLTISGKRQNVKVLRSIDGKMVVYEIDLTDTKSIYSSPAFYIHQNDVIYVEPNKVRARHSTANGNSFVTAPFWLSIVSLLTTAVLYIKNW